MGLDRGQPRFICLTVDLEQFWSDIFSEEAARVQAAWQLLDDTERASVCQLLEAITIDTERSKAQRGAARFALSVLSEDYRLVAAWLNEALTFAQRLADQAAQRLQVAFGGLNGSLKGDGSLVTQADVDTDRWLSAAIRSRYPDHGILSEEQDTAFHGQAWCWVIDPIDGTTNYAHGFPVWGVLIGLLHHGQPVLGVANFPLLDERYSALRGHGAWLNDSPIQTAAPDHDPQTGVLRLKPYHLFACCTRTLHQGRLDLPLKLRVPGTTGYNLALVAKGACVGSLDKVVHVWDVAALWPILLEAGGWLRASLPSGSPFPLQAGQDYGSLTFSVLAACCRAALIEFERQLGEAFNDQTAHTA
jgi:myo-inositol-1(or 4)-monophosphatase